MLNSSFAEGPNMKRVTRFYIVNKGLTLLAGKWPTLAQ